MNVRMCEQTFGRTNMHADRQTDKQMDELTLTPSRTCTHTNASMLTSTHNAHLSTNMEVRSKKLDVRNKKYCTYIDEYTHVWTNIWTHEHAGGQTDRQMDWRMEGLKHTPSHTRAYKRTNACIDELTHVQSNIWMYEHAWRQTDRWMDGLTHTPSCMCSCTHTNASMLTNTHDALRYIRKDG